MDTSTYKIIYLLVSLLALAHTELFICWYLCLLREPSGLEIILEAICTCILGLDVSIFNSIIEIEYANGGQLNG